MPSERDYTDAASIACIFFQMGDLRTELQKAIASALAEQRERLAKMVEEISEGCMCALDRNCTHYGAKLVVEAIRKEADSE